MVPGREQIIPLSKSKKIPSTQTIYSGTRWVKQWAHNGIKRLMKDLLAPKGLRICKMAKQFSPFRHFTFQTFQVFKTWKVLSVAGSRVFRKNPLLEYQFVTGFWRSISLVFLAVLFQFMFQFVTRSCILYCCYQHFNYGSDLIFTFH